MHHKRRRPKSRRAGCLFCKPHKRNHAKAVDVLGRRTGRQEARARIAEREGRGEG
jgi:hypothetical protein